MAPTVVAEREFHFERKSTLPSIIFLHSWSDNLIKCDKELASPQVLSPFVIFPLFLISVWSITRGKVLEMQLQTLLPCRLICFWGLWCWVYTFQAGAIWLNHENCPVQCLLVISIPPIQPLLYFQLPESWIDICKVVLLQDKWCIILSPEKRGQLRKRSVQNPFALY